ncbi:YvrJ family protein [Proteinivorax hydrogeniformans]|uniref:YvrJ family protein n=1 Tax=Proteinivorax hydrogeniformans TaxID=1826727 RepID=A0AAU8HUZ6_9FIRM
MEGLTDVIANFGFPIAITIYLLVRMEKRLERLTESIYQLAKTISAHR